LWVFMGGLLLTVLNGSRIRQNGVFIMLLLVVLRNTKRE
jgi:hypothetical protein